jgi:glutamine amidotransferase
VSERPTIGVIDYGMGNRRSVQKALEHVGAEVVLSSDLDALSRADGLVLPGVGAFPSAMRNLRALNLIELIRDRVAARTPLLGICLGMQLLFEHSTELEPTEGIGVIPGEVRWLASGRLRLPHIGWNDVSLIRRSPLADGLPEGGCPFYHVHSLVAAPRRPADIVATAEYGETFATWVERENVAGVQFHPEKSSADGLRLLGNFVRICRAATGPTPWPAAARA